MNLNASPSPFPIEQISQSFQVASSSSSSSLSCHIFFGPSQDQTGYHQKDDDYAYHGGSSSSSSYNYEIKNKVNNGLKLTLWKKEEIEPTEIATKMNNKTKINRAMRKYCEDQKLQPSSSYNNNSPIRVCADCNTTKTPLWRSGPKGPKSLCNACGIRQRKARRAMAAAASGAVATTNRPPTPTPLKINVLQHKVKTSKNVHFKKRLKMAEGSSSNAKTKIDFEDFLINLSKKLTFHRVFPEEEKDAAILLMALSSGLVHG